MGDKEFVGVANIDRSIEDYIKAGYIKRENKDIIRRCLLWKVLRTCD